MLYNYTYPATSYDSLIVGVIVIISTVVLAYLFLRRPEERLKGRKLLLSASLFIELLFAALLMLFDQNLMQYGTLHWGVLLVYFFLIGVFGALSIAKKRTVYPRILALFSVLLVVAIIADAAFGLPFTQFYSPGGGWSYLFGFGASGTSSYFYTSLYVTGLLLFAVIDFIISLTLSGLKRRK